MLTAQAKQRDCRVPEQPKSNGLDAQSSQWGTGTAARAAWFLCPSRWWVALLVLLTVGVSNTAWTVSAAASAAASAAVKTELQDQFGKTHSLPAEFSAKPLVIVAGDKRATREAMKTWIEALHGRLAGKAGLLGLSELNDVPFFIPNSTITDKMRELFPQQPILCDWDNEVYEAIGFKNDRLVAVAVYNRKGKRVLYLEGKPTAAHLSKILAAAKLP